MSELILSTKQLVKSFHDGTSEVQVLKGVNFEVTSGDKIAIIGPSGSGKSTLLHLLGGLDKPSVGQSCIHGVDWQKMSEKKRCQSRNQYLGFVYQFHHLLAEFTALENVAIPLLLAGINVKQAEEKAKAILDKVGLSTRLLHKPGALSGGERQRVAIARALVREPSCVLADEPTGNLDRTTAMKVFDLMLTLNQQMNTALVIVTHDEQLANRMDKVLSLNEGSLE
jgi:lipoprotein-releasing system ATP-binding protein